MHLLFYLISFFVSNQTTKPSIQMECPSHYACILEKLLYHKDDRFSVFYGGPVTSTGVNWMMSVAFEDDHYQTRACYEIAFVHCDINNAEDADLIFVEASDVNIKFKNELFEDYKVFSDLCSGKNTSGKYIIIRASDVAVPFYPNIYISNLYGAFEEHDQEKIVHFLHSRFKTKDHLTHINKSTHHEEIDFQTDQEISYKPIPLQITINGQKRSFYLVKKILLQDPWKLYYVISCNPHFFSNSSSNFTKKSSFVRLDSGCVSGQIYNDDSCDCLDQLHAGLEMIAKKDPEQGVIIHIPAHDGRGFGTALKAETEIYKKGGRGRVHKTEPLDTIEAAKHLYRSEWIDLRTYDGAARILKNLGIHQAILFTDNRDKVKALENHKIEVKRMKTETTKESCSKHLKSKKNHNTYFKN